MIDNGATPSLVASQRGHADVTQLLCRVRADIDKEVNDGATDIEKSSTSKLWEQKPIILKAMISLSAVKLVQYRIPL